MYGLGSRLKGGGEHGGRKQMEYIYDGLYIITSVRVAAGKDGFNICRPGTHFSCVHSTPPGVWMPANSPTCFHLIHLWAAQLSTTSSHVL